MTKEHKEVICKIIKGVLQYNTVEIEFEKASTGVASKHIGTLRHDVIKEHIAHKEESANKREDKSANTDSISFFSLTSKGWRSFRWDNLLGFSVIPPETTDKPK